MTSGPLRCGEGEAAAGFVLTSTALVMQVLSELGDITEPRGQRIVSILLFEDLLIVPLLAVVAFLAPTELVHEPTSPPLAAHRYRSPVLGPTGGHRIVAAQSAVSGIGSSPGERWYWETSSVSNRRTMKRGMLSEHQSQDRFNCAAEQRTGYAATCEAEKPQG
jgi:hypothetical protein